ncbi:succinate dehydrogenase assembly factor 2 [Congregibacter variabilis]|uniref:FAD assembly factor SdhE n=1 Tax=Congregibacter variabilis TaxID=3081200 RepID=A0ABZ0I573_9GAMM|nr:succinate dehydrogenase assembly factor 2 [Congregibacter sp. IMCC43200]
MDEEHKRMRWASRRGMLELDLILEPFVRLHYAHLDDEGRKRYRELMTCQDQELFDWFLRKQVPDNSEHEFMVRTILSARRAEDTPP